MYDALKDDFGKQVYSVYSASVVYTFLKIYDFDKDERITNSVDKWGEFLLLCRTMIKKIKDTVLFLILMI